jgi:hypothetical protein
VSTQPLRIALAGREHVVDAGTTACAVLAEAGPGEQAPGAHAEGGPIGDAVAEIVTAVRDRIQV